MKEEHVSRFQLNALLHADPLAILLEISTQKKRGVEPAGLEFQVMTSGNHDKAAVFQKFSPQSNPY